MGKENVMITGKTLFHLLDSIRSKNDIFGTVENYLDWSHADMPKQKFEVVAKI